jgi:predicted MFS family arabinose efflux permease
VGDLLGPPTLAAAAVLGFGWRGAFLGLGAAMIGYGAWIACLRLPAPPGSIEDRPSPLAGVLAVIGDRRVLYLALLAGLFGLMDEPLAGFLIAYLERVRGLPATAANAVIMAWLAGELAGYTLYERLAGKRPAARLLLASMAIVALALPLAAFAPLLPIAFAAAAAFGAGTAVFYTTLHARTLALRPGQAGAVSAVVGLTGMLGLGFPALAGLIADRYGLAAGVGLYGAIPLVILVLLGLDRAKPERREHR